MYFQPAPHTFVPLPDRVTGDDWPAIVVGAGPIGMVAALGLARRGIDVLLLEAGDTVSYGSRAICVSRNSLQILDRLGIGERLLDAALAWTGGRSYYRDREVLHFQMPALAEHARPPMVNISQSVAEQILLDAVEAQPRITVRWQCPVTVCQQDAEGVDVTVSTPEGPQRVRGSWLVAADGARSTIRSALGLTMSGTSYEGRYVIADIHWPSDWPTERRVWFDPPSNPGATIIMHRQPDDIWRIDYQLQPDDDAEHEVSDARVHERIAAHLDWVGTTVPWQIEWISLYRAHALSLESYREGRVLLAGDAAHLVPIFGVRGLNSGMEDADDLAWKLALVHRGAADPALLDSFSSERRDAWEQNIAFASKSTLFMTPGSHGYEMTREAALSLVASDPVFAHLVNPRQSSATHARRSPITAASVNESAVQPGDVVDDRIVELLSPEGSRRTTLREATGPEFAVVGFGLGAELLRSTAESAAALLGEPVTAVLVGDRPVPGLMSVQADDALLAAFGASAGDLVVLRPDGRILARARTAREVTAAVVGMLAGHQTGDAPGTADPAQADPAVTRVEGVWQSLAQLLDDLPAERREGALLRVAMQLAVSHHDQEALGRACRTVRDGLADTLGG